MRGFKKYLGKMVKVAFLDHAMGMENAPLCTAMGQVVKIDKRTIVLRYWHCPEDGMDNNINNEILCLIKSTILEIKILR